MAEFVVMYCRHGDGMAHLHAFERGDGSLRDENHVGEIVREFCKGNEGTILKRGPAAGERPLFELFLHIRNTRRGTSTYYGWDYRRHEQCPFEVAREGMELYRMVKALLKRSRQTRDRKRGTHD